MSTKLPGYDKTVVCPYNNCHVILKSRIQTHLVKCEKQHPEIKLAICPFDINHRFRPEEKAVSIPFALDDFFALQHFSVSSHECLIFVFFVVIIDVFSSNFSPLFHSFFISFTWKNANHVIILIDMF